MRSCASILFAALCLAALVFAACGGEGAVPEVHKIDLILVSDVAPEVEAARVVTDVFFGYLMTDATLVHHVERTLTASDALAQGVQVASLESLRLGTHSFRVRLFRRNGELLGERIGVHDVLQDGTYTLVIQAACFGVECEDASAVFSCVSGTCVDARCSPENPEHCPEVDFCERDQDCASLPTASCAAQACVQGVCVETPLAAACAENEYCARGEACAPRNMPPSLSSDRCGSPCRVLDDVCAYGRYRCDEMSASPLCVAHMRRPVGAPCGDGLACDDVGACVARDQLDAGIDDAGFHDASFDGLIIDDAGVDDFAVMTSMDAPMDDAFDAARRDGSMDVSMDAAMDAAPDVTMDVERDASMDALLDAASTVDADAAVSAIDAELETDAFSVEHDAALEDAVVTLLDAQMNDAFVAPDAPQDADDTVQDAELPLPDAALADAVIPIDAAPDFDAIPDAADIADAALDAVLATLDAARDAAPDAPPVDPCASHACGVGTCAASGVDYACSCPSGYAISGGGHTCVDADECSAGTDDCAPGANCTNTVGSFSCACASGYVGTGYGEDGCADVDECLSVNCGIGKRCANSEGGYACQICPSGYTGDGSVCIDVNECLIASTCSALATCVNTPGSFTCSSCPFGYTLTEGTNCVAPTIVPPAPHGMGNGFACGVYEGGAVRCWGTNSNGQLGYGDLTTRSVPIAATVIASSATQIAVGNQHACALLSSGSVQCWGQNTSYQLGLGDNTRRTSPVTVDLGTTAIGVSAGGAQSYSCAILTGGGVKCWGVNTGGVLGVGDATTRQTPTSVAVGGSVVRLASGNVHQCALLSDGTIKCWGSNTSGQLGYGDVTTRNAPASSTIALGGVAHDIAVSASSSCALLDGGAVKCWGSPQTSGYPDQGVRRAPSNDPVPLEAPAIALAGGTNNICAALTNGKIVCWGFNTNGALGYGDTIDRYTPGAALDLGARVAWPVSGIDAACAVFSTGDLKCWGRNSSAFGYGDSANRTSPLPGIGTMPISIGAHAARAAPGSTHTCAMTEAGALHCWGTNTYGQLGYGDVSLRMTPGGAIAFGASAISLAAGVWHTCAVRADGALYCWGSNSSGQLGYGDTSNRIGPASTSVALGQSALSVSIGTGAAGAAHTCVLHADGSIKCWGRNAYGQLGYGDTSARTSVPSSFVSLGGTATAVMGGYEFTCALLNDGHAKCWGLNANGQLGLGDTSDRNAPAGYINTSSTITALSAGSGFACAILGDGTVSCWGTSANLGYGDTTSRSSPGPALALGSTAVSIASNASNTCVALSNGEVRCWGTSTSTMGYGDGLTHDVPSEALQLDRPALAVFSSVNTSVMCALLDDGSLSCWGTGTSGQLGQGTLLSAVQPPSATVRLRGRLLRP